MPVIEMKMTFIIIIYREENEIDDDHYDDDDDDNYDDDWSQEAIAQAYTMASQDTQIFLDLDFQIFF